MELSVWRKRFLYLGTLMMFSVYYLNYGATFDEGELEDLGRSTLMVRLAAIMVVVLALLPLRTKPNDSWLLVWFYATCAVSYVVAIALAGNANDILFMNTILQIPILVAMAQTEWRLDYARLFRFIGWVLALQVAVDVVIWRMDATLWLSQSFVGGLGNPSSFGFACALLFVFYLLHPEAGRWRVPFMLLMALGAVMSKSMLAVLAIALAYSWWAVFGWRRVFLSAVTSVALFFVAQQWFLEGQEEAPSFLMHKIKAALAFLGLMDYDFQEARSVSLREEIHQQTFAALGDDPFVLIAGHPDGLAYWPMDSQLLTYAGSFGVFLLLIFLGLHVLWMWHAKNRADGGFTLAALGLFALIFATNRILDYFPMATLYFICVVMAQSTSCRCPSSPRRSSSSPRPAGAGDAA